ncbi:hypothetical protein ACQ4PT_048323 [Festuca glaucescens]
MADAVGIVTKAVELALEIKDAVDTVRQNSKDCAHIKRRVERVRHTLSLCEGNAELMETPAVRDAVEALAEVLVEALELVTGCQEETNAVCLYCTAGKLSKQLSKVDRGISDGNAEATFAILVYHISKQTGDGARPARPTEVPQPVVVDETLEQTPQSWFNYVKGESYCYNNGGDGGHGDGGGGGHGGHGDGGGGGDGGYVLHEYGYRYDDGDVLQEITRVTLAIRTAMETVRLNKDECVEIDKRASRANMLLSQLEDKEMTKDTAVHGALKSLLKTFGYAHELVAACQRQSSPRNLSSDALGTRSYDA